MKEQDIVNELIDIRLQLGLDFVGIATAIAANGQKEIRWKYVAGNRNQRYQKNCSPNWERYCRYRLANCTTNGFRRLKKMTDLRHFKSIRLRLPKI